MHAKGVYNSQSCDVSATGMKHWEKVFGDCCSALCVTVHGRFVTRDFHCGKNLLNCGWLHVHLFWKHMPGSLQLAAQFLFIIFWRLIFSLWFVGFMNNSGCEFYKVGNASTELLLEHVSFQRRKTYFYDCIFQSRHETFLNRLKENQAKKVAWSMAIQV
jgi:hypothetical protein